MRMTIPIALIICAIASAGSCSAQQKNLTQEDYEKWSTLSALSVSPQGRFGAWQLHYDKADTLLVKQLDNGKKFALPSCSSGAFLGEGYFAGQEISGGLTLLNLKTGTIERLRGVTHYTLSDSEQLLLETASDSIVFYNLRTAARQTFGHVSALSYNAATKTTAFAMGNSITTIYLINKGVIQRACTLPQGVACKSISWHDKGLGFAITGTLEDKMNFLAYYNCTSKSLTSINTANFPETINTEITNGSFSPVLVADDGRSVFFGVTCSLPAIEESGYKVYSTHDKLYGINERELTRIKDGKPRIFRWSPENQQVTGVSHPGPADIFFNATHTFAVTSEPFAYQPQWEQHSTRDYYVRDLANGNRTLLLKGFPSTPNFLSASPDGGYLLYFKAGNWWTYNLVSKEHYNITGQLPHPVYQNDSQYPDNKAMYDKPAWTIGDKSVLVADAFDIWEISPKGRVLRQVTRGRERGIRYRLAPVTPHERGNINYGGSLFAGCYDMQARVLLRSFSGRGDGISLLEGTQVIEIVAPQDHIAMFTADLGRDNILYTIETYRVPPQVVHYRSSKKQQPVFQTNSQHFRFNWGHSELITYSNSKGEQLKAALFYPANYNAEKKYPMVVSIYEKRSGEHNHYVNPCLQNTAGFNISNFTSKGYFVLLPDIAYTLGEPGASALDCVEAAVLKAFKVAGVDQQKVALVGHSYGGYEAVYIITHSKLFKTAVAGAPVTDLLGGYLYAGGYSGVPDYWRYEAGQMRMGATLFEQQQKYLDSSPLHAAAELERPLLLWIGGEDRQVDTSHAFKMHLALRRLQKESLLLEYKNEGHIILDPENQRHLTASVEGWLDHYLLAKELPSWLQN